MILSSTGGYHWWLVITPGVTSDHCVSHKPMKGITSTLYTNGSYDICRLDWEQIFSVGSLVYLAWGLPLKRSSPRCFNIMKVCYTLRNDRRMSSLDCVSPYSLIVEKVCLTVRNDRRMSSLDCVSLYSLINE